jgi:hypothetical protein
MTQESYTGKEETSSQHWSEAATEFLVAEFNNLQEQARQIDDLNLSRVNFFLVVAGAISAGLVSIAGVQSLYSYYFWLVSGGMFALVLIGFVTLRQTILTAQVKYLLYRQCSRIRRWFVRYAPPIRSYTAFEIRDDLPNFVSGQSVFHGGEGIVVITNAILSCILMIAVLIQTLQVIGGAIIAGAVAGSAAVALQHYYIRHEMKRAEENDWFRKYSRFPFDLPESPMLHERHGEVVAQETVE